MSKTNASNMLNMYVREKITIFTKKNMIRTSHAGQLHLNFGNFLFAVTRTLFF